jgi:hypothetical protein
MKENTFSNSDDFAKIFFTAWRVLHVGIYPQPRATLAELHGP